MDNRESAFSGQTRGFLDISPKRQFWSDFAKQVNGSFQMKHTVSRDLVILNLKIPAGDWTIEFNESDTHPLKVVCGINADKRTAFFIIREDMMDKFLKVLGFQDILVFHPEFDEKYRVKGPDEDIVRSVLGGGSVIPLILKTDVYSISCEYDSKRSVTRLTGMLGRTVNSLNEMDDVYRLFLAMMDGIEKR